MKYVIDLNLIITLETDVDVDVLAARIAAAAKQAASQFAVVTDVTDESIIERAS